MLYGIQAYARFMLDLCVFMMCSRTRLTHFGEAMEGFTSTTWLRCRLYSTAQSLTAAKDGARNIYLEALTKYLESMTKETTILKLERHLKASEKPPGNIVKQFFVTVTANRLCIR